MKEQVIHILQRLFWKIRTRMAQSLEVESPELVVYDPQTQLLNLLKEIFAPYRAQISLVNLKGIKNSAFRVEFLYKHTYINYTFVYVPVRNRFVSEASSNANGIYLLIGKLTPGREVRMKEKIKNKIKTKLKGTDNEFRFLKILENVLEKEKFNFEYTIEYSKKLDNQNIDFFLKRKHWETGIKFQIKSSYFFLHKNDFNDEIHVILVNNERSYENIQKQIIKLIDEFENKILYSFR